MNIETTILSRELAKLDLGKSSFLWSAFFMFFNPIFWNVAGRLEFKNRTLSKLFMGNSRLACYALAGCIFSLGLYRDYLFARAIKEQPSSVLLDSWLSALLGPILIFSGNLLVLSSTYQLGITGTFLGDYFGILMERRITGFPYNVTEHPMYEGSTLTFLGYSLYRRSIAGLFLTILVALAYRVASYYEGHFTTSIYAKGKAKQN